MSELTKKLEDLHDQLHGFNDRTTGRQSIDRVKREIKECLNILTDARLLAAKRFWEVWK